MPRYEVFVPAAPPAQPMDLTLRIEAEHWLAALKAGLQKLGAAEAGSNVLCDIQADGSIHVTEPRSTRVFRIQELQAPPPAPAAVAAPPAPARPAPAAPAPARRPSAQADRVEQVAAPAAPPPKAIGRAAPGAVTQEDVLAELFDRVSDLPADPRQALGVLLDLAMEKIGCEAGSVFRADLAATELAFAVTRGPRAGEILKLGLTVPMGVGIAGFCAQENVCLAVSDAQQDPRFHQAVSKAIGHETRSLLCAPIARKGRVLGALEVLNKKGDRPFDGRDLAVLAYVAHQAVAVLERAGA